MSARRTLASLGALVVALALAVSAVLLDASARRRARAREQVVIDLVSARLPSSDLSLSGGARWLRAPSMEEPSAAFAEGPAMPDPDPAGGVMAPPVDAYTRELAPGGARPR
jgi:hypothetical protein